MLGEGKPFTLLHAVAQSDNEAHQVDCLLLHVDPAPDAAQTGDATCRTPNFVTVLEWLTYVSGLYCVKHEAKHAAGEMSEGYLNKQHQKRYRWHVWAVNCAMWTKYDKVWKTLEVSGHKLQTTPIG